MGYSRLLLRGSQVFLNPARKEAGELGRIVRSVHLTSSDAAVSIDEGEESLLSILLTLSISPSETREGSFGW